MTEGRLIQYRCIDCRSLMFKWRVGSEKLEFIGFNTQFIDCPDGKKDVVCRKCGTRQAISNGELTKIVLLPAN